MKRQRTLRGGGRGGTPEEPVPDPQHWQDRAKQAREKARHVKDPRSKRMLQGIAEAYERLARRVRRRLREAEKSHP